MNLTNAIVNNGGKTVSMFVYSQEYISDYIRRSNLFYEHYSLDYIKQRYDLKGKTILDIGANIGNHSVYFSDICGAKVLSFEADRTNYEVLLMNSKGRNITAFNCLVGDTGKYVEKILNENNMGMCRFEKSDGGRSVLSIDSLGLCDVALIKIDVEGMEQEVLRGMHNTIKICKPVIFVEVNENYDEIKELLQGIGYSLYLVEKPSKMFLAEAV